MTILVFLIILTILVLIHELGHFIMAKKFRIKVEEFGFGFPPRAFGIKKGETIYSINWLPIGGFVKLYGEDEAGGGKLEVRSKKLEVADEGRAFYARPVLQRASIVVAGVVMNVLLAIVIFYAFLFISNFKTELPLFGNYQFFLVHQQNVTDLVIGDVAKGSPAEKAGIKPFSKIVSLNGIGVTQMDSFVVAVNEAKGNPITLYLQDLKTNSFYMVTVVPRVSPPTGEGPLGINLSLLSKAVLSYDTSAQKIFSGVIHPLNLTAYNLSVIGKLIGVSWQEKTVEPVGQGVAGPVGIFSLVGEIVKIPNFKERVLQMLNLAGLLSISLALFNVLPIPALDGGRLFFILAEGVTKRKVNPRVESMVHTIGMAILLSLLALITFRDISRLFAG